MVRSSLKLSEPANDNLIDCTIKMWQPHFDRDLSREDARQIVENVTGFFAIVAEWAGVELAETANDTGKPGAMEDDGELHHDA